MQAADTPDVEQAIQNALEDESATELNITSFTSIPPLTVNDARRIIACLENPRFDTLFILYYSLHDAAMLDVFRDGLPLCTSITYVILMRIELGNEELERLLPAFYSTSVRILTLFQNNIQGQRGGEVVRNLLVGNNSVVELNLGKNLIGPEGTIGLGQGLADNTWLRKLYLVGCNIGNDGLSNLLLADGMINNSLTDLDLSDNNIKGAEGGRQVSLLLQRFPALKVLRLNYNNLGPLGAHALAPGLALPNLRLRTLRLNGCGLGNEGVMKLVPVGQVNRSLTFLRFGANNIQGLVGGENVLAVASRCTNLDRLYEKRLNLDQRRRMSLLLDRKRLCTKASALAGSPFPVLFRAVEEAHHHEQGLSAIFLILQNDGDDYFCNANNRAID